MTSAKKTRSRPRKRWGHCNVLQWRENRGQLWQFSLTGKEATTQHHEEIANGNPLPHARIARGWSHLWAPKLNLAWFPPDRLFLRAVHLPKCDPSELPPMLELQLEKLSPLPVSQVVWSYQVMEDSDEEGELQTVILLLAARHHVEQYLGELEQGGFLADQLQIPFLTQVIRPRPGQTGTWIYLVEEGDSIVAFTSWWREGRLQELSQLRLPSDPEAGPRQLSDQLARLAWAGEIESWLTEGTDWHLVAPAPLSDQWHQPLEQCLDCSLTLEPLPGLSDAAKEDALATRRGDRTINLLPEESANRYHQRYIDQLWMRSLGALLVLYCVGVLVYFGFLQVTRYQLENVTQEVTSLANSYTNAVKLRDRIEVLEVQTGLQYAALNSLKVVSELLPAELTLNRFTFENGNQVSLQGTVAPENQRKVNQFKEALRRAKLDGEDVFAREEVTTPRFDGSNPLIWSFEAPLQEGGAS
jgi:hypothetical protein